METFRVKGDRVEIWSTLKVCDSDDRLLSVNYQQGAGGACLRH